MRIEENRLPCNPWRMEVTSGSSTELLRGYHQTYLGKNEARVAVDGRFTGAESPRNSCKTSTAEKLKHCQRSANAPVADRTEYENRQEKSTADVCRCQQQRDPNFKYPARNHPTRCKMSREPEERADSGKSEEEAATTIQAVYRGYKTRRKLHEIRKLSSGEKRNVKKVAELLAIPMDEPRRRLPVDPGRILTGPGNQTRNGQNETQRMPSPRQGSRERTMSRNSNFRCAKDPANLEQRKQSAPQNPTNQREAQNSIKTIKSPGFFSNYDEKTSSPSDNTDTDDPFSPRTDAKSTTTDVNDDVAIGKKNDGMHYPGGDNVPRVKPASKGGQILSSRCNRSLLQGIGNGTVASNGDCYFRDCSLYFPDRESILVFGGVDPHEKYGQPGNTGKDMYRFKPAENIWEFVGEIPEARHHHSVAYLKGRVYVVGGADPLEDKLRRKSIVVGSVWSYDPTSRSWFNEPSMLTARKDFGLVVSHGKMYAIGGQGRDGIALKTVEAFDPSDSTWREVQPMQIARMGPATVKYRDLIWVAGGMTKSKRELFSKDVECYDPTKNLWLKAVPLKSPRCFASFYVLSDRLYLIGGASTTENATQSIDGIAVWDEKDCVWKEHANLSIARHGHSTGSIGDQLLIIGGVTTVFMKSLNSVECYRCDAEKWMKGVSALPYPVSGHGTVTLPPANLLLTH